MLKFRKARKAVVVQGVLYHLRSAQPVSYPSTLCTDFLTDTPLNLDEHWGEDGRNYEMQGIVGHDLIGPFGKGTPSMQKLTHLTHCTGHWPRDPLPEEELWIGQLLVLCLPLAQLCRGVRRDLERVGRTSYPGAQNQLGPQRTQRSQRIHQLARSPG